MPSVLGWSGVVRAIALAAAITQHLPMWATFGLLAGYVILRRSTLLWLVVVIGLRTGNPGLRDYCEKIAAYLCHRRPLPPGREKLWSR
ncbi:MAG: hypothetical protein WBH47_09945 [Streptosporangiaceae bacterium]